MYLLCMIVKFLLSKGGRADISDVYAFIKQYKLLSVGKNAFEEIGILIEKGYFGLDLQSNDLYLNIKEKKS